MTALDLERIRTALADDFTTIDFVEKTGSTNTDLMQATNVADGTVLLADEQLSGKGRPGRFASHFLCAFAAGISRSLGHPTSGRGLGGHRFHRGHRAQVAE